MGLFSKKIDYEDFGVKYEFDLEKDVYCLYKDGKRLSEKEINFRSKRFLKKKNRLTEAEKEERRSIAKTVEDWKKDGLERKILIDKREAAGINLRYGSFEIKEKEYKLSKDVKEYLEDLTAEEKNAEYVLGIHRIGPDDGHLENIFNEGIIVQGHGTGAARGEPSLADTVGYYPDNRTIMKEVGLAYEYKESKGSIVVKIPKEDIASGNIYVMDGEGKNMFLNPKYIVGYFPFEQDKSIDKKVTKDTLLSYREEQKKEAEEYLRMGEKTVEYPPQEK